VNPLAAASDGPALFATHPPTADRIRILRSMAGASLAAYETAYQKANGGTLIGPESLRTDPATPIRPAADAEPIATRQEVHTTALQAHGYVPVTCRCGTEIQVPANRTATAINCIRCGTPLPIPPVMARG